MTLSNTGLRAYRWIRGRYRVALHRRSRKKTKQMKFELQMAAKLAKLFHFILFFFNRLALVNFCH